MTTEAREPEVARSPFAALSNALVAVHKEQFGRGPTKARSGYVGDEMIVSVLHNVLMPAELALVEMGEANRVREARLFHHVATEGLWMQAVKEALGRTVLSCMSAVDPTKDVLSVVFLLEPRDPGGDEQASLALDGLSE